MNRERIKRQFMLKIVAALAVICLLTAGCITYFSEADRMKAAEDYTLRILDNLRYSLDSCASEKESQAVSDGMDLAFAAEELQNYDWNLEMWDATNRLNTLRLYQSKDADNGRIGLKSVDMAGIHTLFIEEQEGQRKRIVLEDWFSKEQIERMGSLNMERACKVRGYEREGVIEPTGVWLFCQQEDEMEGSRIREEEFLPVKKPDGKKEIQTYGETFYIMDADWQGEQLKDESWEALQKAAAAFTVPAETVADTGENSAWTEYDQKPGIKISTGFIKLKTGDYWLGFSIVDYSLRSTLQNSKWIYFFLAFGCFLAGVMIISSYFRVLDQQYETELRRRRMSDAMAHEMKTPLGIIKNYSEALSEEENKEKCSHYLEAISRETDSMNDMIVRLLELSKMEAGTYPLKLGVTSVSRIAQRVLERGEILLLPKNLQVEADIGEDIRLLIDEKLLRESITNLMVNAVHYSDRDSTINLTVRKEKGGVRIGVENQGKPVPKQDGERIWESFYRGEAAREGEVSGNGLGLAIVASTCTLHKGRCGFENRSHGVEFWMYIPDQENRQKERSSPIGPLMQEKKRGVSLPGLQWSIIGTILWLLPYGWIFFAWRYRLEYEVPLIPWLISIPGWILCWLGAYKMRALSDKARWLLFGIPILLIIETLMVFMGRSDPEALSPAVYGLLPAVGLYFLVISLICRQAAGRFGNERAGKFLYRAAVADAGGLFLYFLLKLFGLTVSFGLQAASNVLLALASMGAVFNVCLWYDLYRRYHFKDLP